LDEVFESPDHFLLPLDPAIPAITFSPSFPSLNTLCD
jgi:hypothetical protein